MTQTSSDNPFMASQEAGEHVVAIRYPAGWVVGLLRVLSVAAFGVACYLAWASLHAGTIAGCAEAGVWDCEHVLHSRWSKWLGIPVSVPAAAMYATMIVGLVFVGRSAPDAVRNLAWSLVTVLAIAAGAAAVWFVGLQVFVLGQYCKYCMAVHAAGLLICTAVLVLRPLGARLTSILSGMGLAATSLLVIGQVVVEPPPTYAIDYYDGTGEEELSDNGENEILDFEFDDDFDDFDAPVFEETEERSEDTSLAIQGPEASYSPAEVTATTKDMTSSAAPNEESLNGRRVPEPTFSPLPQAADSSPTRGSGAAIAREPVAKKPRTAKKKRVITYPGARANLNVAQWPLLGSDQAPHVVVELFDYTCPHCLEMSQHLEVARQRFGEQLAIIVLPVPLENQCNDTVMTTSSKHINSCEIARLALAVWRVDPAVFPVYHRWLLSAPSRRSAAEARVQAESLVDANRLRQELAKPLVGQFIARHVSLYKRAGRGTLPKLLTEKMTVRGKMGSAEELCATLQNSLGLTPVGR